MTSPVAPISPNGSRAAPLAPAPTRRPAGDRSAASSGERPAAGNPSPPALVAVPSRSMRVEVSMAPGAQTVTIYDETTGQPIYQAPPEHTRQVLDRATRSRATHGPHRAPGR